MIKAGEKFYAKSFEDVLAELKTEKIGLTNDGVEARKLKYGLNEIPEKKPN